MGKKRIEVPDIGDFTDVPVIDVYISAGDEVSPEDPLIALESAKAVMDVPSPYKGTILEVLVKEGDTLSQGDPIAEIEIAEEKPEAEEPSQEKTEEKQPEPEEEKQPEPEEKKQPEKKKDTSPGSDIPVYRQEGGAAYHATPSTRQFARRAGVDLSQVKGTGVKGRILNSDVEHWISQALKGKAGGSALPEIPKVDPSAYGPVETRDLTRIQKLSGPHVHASWVNIPHVTHYDEADVTELEALRSRLKQEGERHSILSFVIPALIRALKEYPDFNASLDPEGEKVIHKRYYHIGIAVDTPQGLVVPVIRDADKMTVGALTKALGDVSERARKGALKAKDIQGGSFSISSLGGIGGVGFTPIINAPESAILGLSSMQTKPVWDESTRSFVPRKVMPFSVSYDHRIIDGAQGARFARYLGELLNDIRRILL